MTTNKQRFLDAFARFAAGDTDVLSTLLRDDFVTHKPGFDRAAFVAALTGGPGITLRHVIAEDDFVVTHSATSGAAAADFWRFEDGLIVEHWDVVQPPASTA